MFYDVKMNYAVLNKNKQTNRMRLKMVPWVWCQEQVGGLGDELEDQQDLPASSQAILMGMRHVSRFLGS